MPIFRPACMQPPSLRLPCPANIHRRASDGRLAAAVSAAPGDALTRTRQGKWGNRNNEKLIGAALLAATGIACNAMMGPAVAKEGRRGRRGREEGHPLLRPRARDRSSSSGPEAWALRCGGNENGERLSALGAGKYFILPADPGSHSYTVKSEATDPPDAGSRTRRNIFCEVQDQNGDHGRPTQYRAVDAGRIRQGQSQAEICRYDDAGTDGPAKSGRRSSESRIAASSDIAAPHRPFFVGVTTPSLPVTHCRRRRRDSQPHDGPRYAD